MGPMFFNRAGEPVALENSFAKSSAFLVCGGPSLATHDLSLLWKRGILALAVNNAATLIRPNLWVCVDSPTHFADAIWRDPGIWKFVPDTHMAKTIAVRDAESRLVDSVETVGQMPAVFGYRRNEDFVPDRWLTEDTFNWGCHSKKRDADGLKGSRSVFLVALRLLHVLGVRTVYLLGCDFRMELGKANYAFPQDRSPGSVRGNNKSYEILNVRLGRLKPHFDQSGFRVFNCTPNSGLKVFPYAEYADAIAKATERIPEKILTAGMYDQAAREHPPALPEGGKAGNSPAPLGPEAPGVLQWDRNERRNASGCPVDFTTVVGVDDAHLEEWKKTWPTWVKHRPEILSQPLLIVCDGARAESHWHTALDFVNHPCRQIVLWNQPGADQRAKMLTAITLAPADHVKTSWFLKLDTDAVAMGPAPWIRPEWFGPDAAGHAPVFVAPRWGYSTPPHAIRDLDDWADTTHEFKPYPRLDLPFEEGARWVRHPRIISWCFFGRCDWLREVTAPCGGKLPFPSHDTYLWFCAARRRDHFRAVSMRDCRWHHTFGRDPREHCDQALAGQPLAEEKLTPTSHAVKLLELLEHGLPNSSVIRGAEIGVGRGVMSQALLEERPDLHLTMVDHWNGGKDTRHYRAADRRTRFASDRRTVVPKRSTAAAAEVADGTLDFVFLDADHGLESVRADIRSWWPKLKAGGLLSGHDYGHPHDVLGRWGVKRAADEWAASRQLALDVCPKTTVWSIRKPSIVGEITLPPRHVFYLLTHAGHAPRLAVSIWSLRQHYDGPVTVYTTLPESHELVARLAADRRWNVTHRTMPHPEVNRNSSYLAKPTLVRAIPEPAGLFLDADTLVAGDISPLFDALGETPFVATRFMDWNTSKEKIRNRIESWRDLVSKHAAPERLAGMIDTVVRGTPMINSGIFAWRKDTPLRGDWLELTRFGHRKFICDETALQILLPRYDHRMLDCRFNCSSRYGGQSADVRIWHFHGGAHLKAGKGRDRWLPAFHRCLEDNPAGLRDWAAGAEPGLTPWMANRVQERAIG